MRKALSISLLTLSVFLIACSGGSKGNSENAGKAMAETACLLFNEGVTMDSIQEKTTEIMEKYGFESPADVDTYLTSIKGTEEINKVAEVAREQLEASCGEALTAGGITAADLAEAMIQ